MTMMKRHFAFSTKDRFLAVPNFHVFRLLGRIPMHIISQKCGVQQMLRNKTIILAITALQRKILRSSRHDSASACDEMTNNLFQ